MLDAATREAAAELAKRAKLPPDRLVLGGRSMGGRYCSMVVGADEDPVPALGLLMLSYPLHAAGQAREGPRRSTSRRSGSPCCSSAAPATRWPAQEGLTTAARAVPGPVSFHWIDTADHGYRPLKASGRTTDDVLAEVADASVAWVAALARLNGI